MNDSDITALLKRVERLEAIEEIKDLKQRSALAADPNMDIDMFINNYTEDGIMEIVNWGTVLKGRKEIAERSMQPEQRSRFQAHKETEFNKVRDRKAVTVTTVHC